MDVPAHAVHRTIVCVDVEGFGDRRRTNPHQIAVRDGLYRCLRSVFATSGIDWLGCYHEDRGDGVLVLVPPEVPKDLLVAAGVLGKLAAALAEHNRGHDRRARIRLRLAVHAGEIHYDEHGVAGTAINLACRLLEAEPLKRALGGSAGVLAVVASQWFFEEVIRHTAASGPSSYRRVRVSVKETQEIAWICLPDDPYPPEEDAGLPSAPMVTAPRQLPAPISGFVGRAAELKALTGLLEQTVPGDTVVISAIDGTAGIGKTALAVHWAHQVAGRFSDGQLYVNLRGFDPTGTPMTSAEAVRGFLDAFEVPPERIPFSLDAQAALYRSLLAGRRMLIVLDSARDADQVRPLLPGAPGCVVVVTSRNHLTSLITADGAHPLTLDLLTTTEARQLLARRLGAGRVTAEHQAAEELITLCARLPLALAIVAARAAAHPTFPLAALARELRDARGGLDAFHSREVTVDARAVFSWSYQQLTTEAARLFRLLGLHSGPDITAPAAASLADIPAGPVRLILAELTRAHLIAEHVPGRFTFHDLLRAYATELTHTHDPEPERHAAVLRMLDHYLHTAHTAALRLYSRVGPITVIPPQPGVTPEEFTDHKAAWAWFAAEYPVLLAAIQFAAATEHTTHAWQLPWTLLEYFERGGHWRDWATAQHTALTAAERGADRLGQAHAHRGLGRARNWPGHRDEKTHTHLRQALRLFEELDDQAGQADTHRDLGRWYSFHGRIAEGLTHHQRSLALSRTADYPLGQAQALTLIGWHYGLLGDQKALTHCEQALAQQRELGDRRGESHTLDSLGYAHHRLGHHHKATTYLKQSLALQRELSDRYGEAIVLNHLGHTYHATGDLDAARDAWLQALHILDHLDQIGLVLGASPGYPDTDGIRTELHRLDTPVIGAT